MIDREKFQRVVEIFERATLLHDHERAQFLFDECGDDTEIHERVLRMLDADRQTDDILDRAPLEYANADASIGTTVGNYQLVELIGSGGMGVVYRAKRIDGAFEQEVAIKRVRGAIADDNLARRFDMERQVLAALSHPNIARLLDADVDLFGRPCVVMELVIGKPIDLHCDDEALSPTERLRLFTTVCRAVHHAHQNLVLHRDLKPGNIFVDQNGNPKLLDFGIARLLDDQAQLSPEEITETRVRRFTPEYASPEQFTGERLTVASDVYSLGVVLYRLLTGASPYRADSQAMTADQTALGPTPPRPSSIVYPRSHPTTDPLDPVTTRANKRGMTPKRLSNLLSGDLDQITLKAMHKEPARRYSSSEEFAADIDRYLAGLPVLAQPDGVIYRSTKMIGRHRVAFVSATIAVLSLVTSTIVSVRSATTAARERDAARLAEEAIASEAEHARIEARSAGEIQDFLLGSYLASGELSDDQRQRAVRTIETEADSIRRRYPDEPHLRANLLDALGTACIALGSLDEAARLIEESLAVRRQEFGDDSLETALSLASRGELQLLQGDGAGAEISFQEALRLHETCRRGVHTDVAAAANNLAVAVRRLGRLDEATALHTRALELRRADGADLYVAESLNNLSAVLLDQHRNDEAAQLMEEALDVRRRVLGATHPLSLQSQCNLATILYRLGQEARAEELLSDAVEGYRSLASAGSDGLMRALQNLATFLLRRREFDSAARCLEEASTVVASRYGEDHPRAASLLERMAMVEQQRGETEKAEEMLRRALAIRRATLPDGHLAIGKALQGYGVFLVDNRRYEEALGVFDECLALYTEAAMPEDPDIARVLTGLGMCHAALGDLERAVQELEEAHRRLVELLGVEHRDTATAERRLREVLEARHARRESARE